MGVGGLGLCQAMDAGVGRKAAHEDGAAVRRGGDAFEGDVHGRPCPGRAVGGAACSRWRPLLAGNARPGGFVRAARSTGSVEGSAPHRYGRRSAKKCPARSRAFALMNPMIDQIAELIQRCNSPFGAAPTFLEATLPSLNSSSVGIDCMPILRGDVRVLVDVELDDLDLALHLARRSPRAPGRSCGRGRTIPPRNPPPPARTDWSTSCSKLASVTLMVTLLASPMMNLVKWRRRPDGPLLDTKR